MKNPVPPNSGADLPQTKPNDPAIDDALGTMTDTTSNPVKEVVTYINYVGGGRNTCGPLPTPAA